MAHDERLAARFREALKEHESVSEMRMMGGLCLFVSGHMVGGTDRAKDGSGRFMFRVGKANSPLAERLPGADLVILGERTMPGFYFVRKEVCDDNVLKEWAALAVGYALSLPAK